MSRSHDEGTGSIAALEALMRQRRADLEHGYVRPRDSATLIVIRSDAEPVRVLMGRRSEGHVFMPGKLVFPGGRVDPADSRIRPASDLRPEVAGRLMKRMRGPASMGRARALAMAAIRETFEETGLLIGEPARGGRSRSPVWQAFFDAGVRPSLAPVHFVARAITPPGRPRRFDSRFFVVDARHIVARRTLPLEGEEELLDINWLTFDEALAADTPRVTQSVLTLVRGRLGPDGELCDGPVPFWRMERTRFRRDEL